MKRWLCLCWLVAGLCVAATAAEEPNPSIVPAPDKRPAALSHSVDRGNRIISFRFKDMLVPLPSGEVAFVPDLVVRVDGLLAKKWLELADRKRSDGATLNMGRLLRDNPLVPVKSKGDDVVEGIQRYERGCLFYTAKSCIALDWDAAKDWEKKGGLKVGFPKKDLYRIWVVDAAKPV